MRAPLSTPAALAVALALLAIATPGCKEKHADSAPAKAEKKSADVELSDKALEAAKLSVVQSKTSPRRVSVTCAGTIDFEPKRVAKVGPSVSARVATVLVQPGQKVTRGQSLVILDSVDVGRARADWLAAKSKLSQAEAELSREKKLFEGGASSERAMLTAETEKRMAEVGRRAAEDRLRALGAGAGEGSANGVALTSPLAGSVLDVKARVGQPVGSTDTLVVVGEVDVVWLSADIYERDVAKVHVGDEVRVSTPAYPGRVFVGKVDAIGTVIDADRRVLPARIVLPNPDAALKPGMTATSRILGETLDEAGVQVVVPRGAIQTIDGQPFVFVEKSKGKYDMRAVERGADIEGDVEVLRGLAGGEPVVVDGSFILKSEILREQMGSND